MKRAHRVAHGMIWALLPVLLLLVIFLADRHRLGDPPPVSTTADASAAGVLP